MKLKSVCLDMDGTIADLYNYPNWKELLESESTEPYLYCKPMFNQALINLLNGFRDNGIEVNIITWYAKQRHKNAAYDKAVKDAKEYWLAKYGIPYDNFIGLKYGKPKHKAIRLNANENSILVDDNYKICKTWNKGRAINPRHENMNRELYKILWFVKNCQ